MPKKVIKKVNSPITIEGGTVIFKNFSGKQQRYNREGDRNFCVLLDDEDARIFSEDGWNVKVLPPREEGDEPQPYMKVKVVFNRYPPKVIAISERSGKQEFLDRDTIRVLDFAQFKDCDMIIRPYNWGPNAEGKSGVAAYLGTMYATIEEDPFEAKYRFEEPDEEPPWED